LTAFYPLRSTTELPTAAIRDAVSVIAAAIGCRAIETLSDLHEGDAQRTIDEFIRDHRITRPQAIERLSQQKSLIVEQYERIQYRWRSDVGEIDLVLTDDNVIPFPDNDIASNGQLRFACGWIEFGMPDRRIEQLQLHDHARTLPLLIAAESN